MSAPVRSILFVPGDSERKIEKSRASKADALVLDLEDSVAPSRKGVARETVAAMGAPASRAPAMTWITMPTTWPS